MRLMGCGQPWRDKRVKWQSEETPSMQSCPKTGQMTPQLELAPVLLRLGALMGSAPTACHTVARGYTPAYRAVVTLENGVHVFIKIATDALTARWLHAEHKVYAHLHARFMPALLGFDAAAGTPPMLVLENLSEARWPPPWEAGDVAAVLDMLGAVGRSRVPFELPALASYAPSGWKEVAADPAPFLALGLTTAHWLTAALPTLVEAERLAPLDGDDLLHLDVRSDNLCFGADGPRLLDWNCAQRGNALADVAAWLPSLAAEGGPAPATVLPGQPELAAWVSGFFAARAGLAPVPKAPGVRPIQRVQLQAALPWVIEALGLPPI
jgi:hypothetical protein